jgi:hypothetical protein
MKRILLILFLVQISLNAFPQNLKEKLNNILTRINEKTPADQLFLHIDRNLYYTGDTIRFQAYIRDSQTGVIETLSKSLYVLLLNSDHVTLDSARFRIAYSTSSGWLKVPDTIPVGFYSIVAFTSDQMNFDPKFAFNTPVRVEKIRNGRTSSEPLESKGVSSVDLRFLPEGGTFIYGVRQRLSFNAVTSAGKNIMVSGEIINQNGKKITEMRSGKYGPGVIEFTPHHGETYYARPVEKELGNMSWPLPEPENSGVSMRVDNINPGVLDIILRSEGTTGKDYFLTGTMNNILIFSYDIRLDTLFSARIKTGDIPSGTASITLYDKELNPLAERLIILNADKKMKVQIGLSKPNTRPGKETELTVNTTDEKGNNISSIISVSVIDSSLGFYNCIPYPDIESVFLYKDEFYNNLPQSVRSTGLKNIDNKSVDLLMMTYGWRKYTVRESALTLQEKRSDNYDQIKISNPGNEKRGRQEIRLLSPEGGEVISLRLNENREALLPFDSLDPGARQVMVLPDDDPSRNANPITFEFSENKPYTNSAKLLRNDSSYTDMEVASTVNEQPVFNPDSAIMIESVTIKGHRKQSIDYADKNAEEFKYVGSITLYNKDFKYEHTFEDVLYKIGAYKVDKKSKKVILRAIQYMPKIGNTSVVRPALFVVDNNPIFDKTYATIAQMPTSEIASITVIRGSQGFARYGNDASNGVILVTTRTGNRINGIIDPNEEAIPFENHMKQVRLFRSEVEYYIPTKEQVEIVNEYQFRPTILWKDFVYLDGTGPITLNYPNNMRKGIVMIFINGVSFTNLIGSISCSYEDK